MKLRKRFVYAVVAGLLLSVVIIAFFAFTFPPRK